MKNFADHILDIAENAIRARASLVIIELHISRPRQEVTLCFKDDGEGMDAEMVQRISNPFFSTRKERKIGMGIPLLIQNSELSGGGVKITSDLGHGTEVKAIFMLDSMDIPPFGDVADALYFLVSSHPTVQFSFDFQLDDYHFLFDTKEVVEALEGMSLNEPELKGPLMEILSGNITLPL